MKKLVKTTVMFLLFLGIVSTTTNSYAQEDYSSCKAKLEKLKRECEKIDPSDELEIEFINTVDELERLPMKIGTPTNWYVVGPLFDELLDLTDDVKQKRCTSATCKTAKKIVDKLKGLFKEEPRDDKNN